jgi:hypothetical protein
MMSRRQIYGDAAPRSFVKKPRSGLDFSSTSSIDEPSRVPGKMSSRYIYGDVSPPAKIYNAPNGIGHSTGASMSVGRPTKRVATSPRIR